MPNSDIHPPFEAYNGTDPYVFVSYSHRDSVTVFQEIQELHQDGYRVWYDEGIDPGNEWPEEVATALSRAAMFLVFVSGNSVASQNVRNEINFALNNRKPFLAIYLSETELPVGLQLRMGDIQAVMKHRLSEDSYRRKLEKSLPESLRLPREENDLRQVAPIVRQEPATDETDEGQCGACGTINSIDRAFCRKCGDPLREPCLNCNSECRAWELFCGVCGTRVSTKRDELKVRLTRLHDEAIRLEESGSHSAAISICEELLKTDHPRFRDIAAWANDQLPILRRRVEIEHQRIQLFADIAKYRDAHDYDQLVRAIEHCPREVRDGRIEELLVEAHQRRQQLQTVRQQLRDACEKNDETDIGKLVGTLLELNPDMEAAQRECEAWLQTVVVSAKATFDRNAFSTALAMIRRIPTPLVSPEVVELRERSLELEKRQADLLCEATDARRSGNIAALLNTLSKLAAICPEVRSEQSEVLEKMLFEVREKMRQYRPHEALAILNELSPGVRDGVVDELISRCRHEASLLDAIQAEVISARTTKDIPALVASLQKYLECRPDDSDAKTELAHIQNNIEKQAHALAEQHQYRRVVSLLLKFPHYSLTASSMHLKKQAEERLGKGQRLSDQVRAAAPELTTKTTTYLKALSELIQLLPRDRQIAREVTRLLGREFASDSPEFTRCYQMLQSYAAGDYLNAFQQAHALHEALKFNSNDENFFDILENFSEPKVSPLYWIELYIERLIREPPKDDDVDFDWTILGKE